MVVGNQSSTSEAVQQDNQVATDQGLPRRLRAQDTVFSMPVVGEAQELLNLTSNLDQSGHCLQGEGMGECGKEGRRKREEEGEGEGG